MEQAVRLQRPLVERSRRDLDSPYPGLVRWSPVEGATAYQVWLLGAKTIFMTTTNVADARELYTFHRDAPHVDERDLVRVRAKRSALRRGRERPADDDLRPVEPASTPTCSRRCRSATLADLATIVRHRRRTRRGSRARASRPGFAFGGDSGGLAGLHRRRAGRALPRLRRHRPGLRQHRLPRRDRRQPGLRTAPHRPARAAAGRRVDVGRRRTKVLDFGGRGRGVHARRHSPSTTEVAATAGRRGPSGSALGHAGARQDRPARHGLADRRLLLDGRPCTSSRSRRRPPPASLQPRHADPDRVPRDRAAAGRLPVRPRHALRQDEPAGRDERRSARS